MLAATGHVRGKSLSLSSSDCVLRLLAALAVVIVGPLAPSLRAASAAKVRDLSGRVVDPRPGPGAPPSVLVFTRTDCPVSNRYAPELRRLHQRFAPAARFWLVYPDPTEEVAAIERHRREFGFGFAALRDPGHALVGLTGATVTPEVAVLVAGRDGPLMVYRGRIDDRAVEVGRTRPRPTTHDLEDVLASLAAGGTPTPRTTRAVGCIISP